MAFVFTKAKKTKKKIQRTVSYLIQSTSSRENINIKRLYICIYTTQPKTQKLKLKSAVLSVWDKCLKEEGERRIGRRIKRVPRKWYKSCPLNLWEN